IDPGFRVLDAPETARAAREAFDDALVEFLKADGTAGGGPVQGDPAREEPVAAYDIEGLRAAIVGVHEELRSRGIAQPQLPDPPAADPEAAIQRAIDA